MSMKMRTPEAAAYLTLSIAMLVRMRVKGEGPPFAKLGKRVVLYDRDELDQWVSDNQCQSTSEYSV